MRHLLCAAALLGGGAAPPPVLQLAPGEGGGRIVGGEVVRGEAAQWQAELFMTFPDSLLKPEERGQAEAATRHSCGASLIAADWILTAAHCVVVKGLPVQDYAQARRVRVGSHSLHGGLVIDIDRPPLVDPLYGQGETTGSWAHDAALIHLARPVPSDDPVHIRLIRLHDPVAGDAPLAAGQAVSVTGWGRAEPGARAAVGGMVPDLMVVGLFVKPDFACGTTLSATEVCAGDADKGACVGDSGGPLVRRTGARYTLVGIVSHGDARCQGRNYASAYTRVEAELPWIRRTLAAAGARLPS